MAGSGTGGEDVDVLQTSAGDVLLHAIDSITDYAIFLLTPEGNVATWNGGAMRIKGYTPDEIIGRHFSCFYTDEARQRGWPAEALRQAAAAGRFEDEGWRVRKDGTRFWANLVLTAARDASGALVGFTKVTRDLTARRKQEDQLREREESLRLLIEGTRDHALFLLDTDGRIRSWNPGARRVLGHASDSVMGRDFALLYPPEDVAAGRPRADLLAATAGRLLQTEGWRQRANGARVWCECTLTLLNDAAGEPRGFVQLLRDMTERRRVEQLEDEGRRVTEFIAMLSHELRNPLNSIRSAMEVLRQGSPGREVGWAAELIDRQVEHMRCLVDDLLDVSRVSSGRLQLERGPLELRTLVRMAIDGHKGLVDARHHQLKVRLPALPVQVLGDATRLVQVIVNLLGNATKYTPPGGEISVTLEADARFASLRVTDSGCGMSEVLMQSAFEPFVQGERTKQARDRAEGGLGIGLTLVKRIVELHGGTVALASPGIGLGTTATLTLPIDASTLPRGTPERDDDAPLPAVRAFKRTQRVLVVDDNADAADSLALLLRVEGHQVQVAYDGPQAIAVARGFRPDFVLLDVGLPGMSGLDLARHLREFPELSGVRLIAITGYGQSADIAASRRAGLDFHLVKPVRLEDLARLLV